MPMPKLIIPAAILGAFALSAGLAGCNSSDAQESTVPPPPEVSVSAVVTREVAQWDEFTGRIEAVESVELRPRVGGYIDKVLYREGQEVRKNELLFLIDPRPYRAALEQAAAELARAQTQAGLARTEAARADKLKAAHAISQEEYEQRVAGEAQAGANVRAAQAAADMARLNLSYTEVRSPIGGRAGRALVTAGNLVSAQGSPTLLTTVVSLDPVYAYFQGDEQTYLRYGQMARDGERPSSRDARNPVQVGLANEEGFPHSGYMDFVDNRLDPATGTIRARAVLDNRDRVFTPGLFARVRLLGSGTFPALLIDDKAVLTDQDRKYVYVLGPENKALRRDVKLGRIIDGQRMITDGLAQGDQVIVSGVQKIFFPGMAVKPSTLGVDTATAPPAAHSPG